MSYEVCIKITDEKYIDKLVVSLVRQGYSVYLNTDESKGLVCFTAYEDEVTELKT